MIVIIIYKHIEMYKNIYINHNISKVKKHRVRDLILGTLISDNCVQMQELELSRLEVDNVISSPGDIPPHTCLQPAMLNA